MRFSIGRGFFGAALALGALSLAPPAVAQQTAAVQGMITDIASGAPIADARVTIVGTVLQSTTNVLGNYRITGIPAGNVSVQVRRIGYKTLTAAVTLAEGQEFTGNYALNASVVQLEEIVVTGTAGDQRARSQAAQVAVLDVAGVRQGRPAPPPAAGFQSGRSRVFVPPGPRASPALAPDRPPGGGSGSARQQAL